MKINRILAVLILSLTFNSVGKSQSIALGGRHSLMICQDSTVRSWGFNSYGQLGNATMMEQHAPVMVTGLSSVVQIAGGLFHSLFVKRDGTVWSCGRNAQGPLGDGSNSDKNTPVQIPGLNNIVYAAGGGEHSLFVKSDGTVWACGLNSSGQLGDGTLLSKNRPVQITSISDVVQVATGAEYSLFLKSDGTVWACGHNGNGQYGNGNNMTSRSPLLITGLSDITQITCGEWHSFFVKKDGSVWASGRNNYGQLGDGTTIDRNTAFQIPGLSGVVMAEAGGIHSVFVKSDGSVWACGLNSGGNNDGQLGDGTIVDKSSPVKVIESWGAKKIIHAEATREHTLFLTEDGEIWASGRNNYGQLGTGTSTLTNARIPVQTKTNCPVLTSLSDDYSMELDILIYPNPSNGIFNLNLPQTPTKLKVYNPLGQLIFSGKFFKGSELIDVSNHPSGIYILQWEAGHQRMCKKISIR